EIEDDAALAAVVELEGGIHVGLVRHQPRRREAAQGIPFRRLDLHHARAPVGEHGGGRGHGHPDAELQHAHALQGSRHGGRPCHGRAPLCKPAAPWYTAGMAEDVQVLGPTSHYFYSQRLKLHYADRVARLVAIEGLGPPAGLTKPPSAAARMLQWLREMQALARRHPRPYATLEEAITRMREANPHLTEEQARHLTVSGVIRHEDGTYAWKFDNFVRAVSPYLFNVDEAREIWSHITCP